ncbi:MAG: FMN-binding negative transcriptional regulator [Myxococcota bacterium]
MHPNPLFRAASRDDNLAFVRVRGFGVLTVNGPDGPRVAHLPFVLDETGETVEFHLARKSPLSAALPGPLAAVLVVSGPDAYVSPDWYGLDEQVPTWNYVAVHVRGTLVAEPPETLAHHLDRLAAAHEPALDPKPPWTQARVSAAKLAAMRAAIVPLRLRIEAVDGTWKLGQNKPEAAREAAAQEVEAAGYGSETATLAEAMRRVRG